MTAPVKFPLKISGSGGGGGSSGGGSPIVASNTLQSNTIAQIIEMLGEGPIEGLVNGAQSIYFNETPLQNPDGTYNFGGLFVFDSTTSKWDPVTQGAILAGETWLSGVAYATRNGLVDQDPLPGFPAAATTTQVGEQVKQSVGPIVRTIEDEDVSQVLVNIGIPALYQINPSNGSTLDYNVSWQIAVAPFGGDYDTQVDIEIVGQKTATLYIHQSLINLPAGGAPWNIQVTRTAVDEDGNPNAQNQTFWESFTEITSGQFTYPNTALVGLSIDAEFFGQSVPTRGYLVKGLQTEIPSNYDPVAKTYSGIWDGTFVTAWHSNPAWVLYALITNKRWGIGEFVQEAIVDKWQFYTIGQYCDEMIPSGFTLEDGTPVLEPRFVYNGVIANRQEAYKVLQDVASAFRGMAYWSLGQVFPVADMPKDPVTTVAPANVVGGAFQYSGTSMKSRHSVVAVSWNNPQDFYRPAIELVQNDDMIQLLGWRQKDVAAPGCTSRGQALRFGKWILDTEQHETETVAFSMSWDSYILPDGVTLKPGDIINVADPRKTGGPRIGGRLKAVDTAVIIDDEAVTQITIDSGFQPGEEQTYSLTVALPDGSIETQSIASIDDTNTILTMGASFSQTPQVNAMWVISGSDVNPRTYRVLSVEEQDSHLFKITGLQYDPTKFDRVEQDIALSPPTYVRPNNIMGPPLNAVGIESNYLDNGTPASRLTLSWTQPATTIAVLYKLTASSGPIGSVDFGSTKSTSIDILGLVPGEWTFNIVAVSTTGLNSIPLPLVFDIQGWSAVSTPTAENLALLGGGTQFTANAPTIIWDNVFPSGTEIYALDNIVRVYNGGTNALLRTETVRGTSYTYSFEDNVNDGGPVRNLKFTVTAKSVLGIEQDTPATITVSNPQAEAITPVVSSVLIAINTSWTDTEIDYAGAKVWISANSGFDPLTTTPDYDGTDFSVEINRTTPGTYYVRVAAYDVFGEDDLNFGPEVAVVCQGMDLQAFTDALQDQITTQFQTINDEVASTLATIATAASEQDAANKIDKTNLRSFVGDQIIIYDQIVQSTYATSTDVSTAINEAITTVETTASEALSSFETTVTAEFDSTNASVSTVSTAVAGVNGKLAAAWTLTLDTNGYVSGIQAFDNGADSNIILITDNFEVASPAHGLTAPVPLFSIADVTIGGVTTASVVLNGNLIADGTISAAKIEVGTITADQISVGAINASDLIANNVIVTGHLKADTATSLAFATGSNTTASIGGSSGAVVTLCSMSYTAFVGQLIIDGSFDITAGSSFINSSFQMVGVISVDGVVVREVNCVANVVANDGSNNPLASSFGTTSVPCYANVAPGAHTITLSVSMTNLRSGSFGFNLQNIQLRLLESMR